MRNMWTAAFAAVVGLPLAVGCVGCADRSRPSTTATQSAVMAQAAGPYVPAGTVIEAAIDRPLGTDFSHAGDAFSATVLSPVRAADGSTLIQQGARLTGTLIAVQQGLTPKLELEFDAIQTRSGDATLDGRLIAATQVERPLPQVNGIAPPRSSLVQPSPPLTGSSRSPATQPGATEYIHSYPNIGIPKGGRLRIELNVPLLAPRR